jgi:hypothetical protein
VLRSRGCLPMPVRSVAQRGGALASAVGLQMAAALTGPRDIPDALAVDGPRVALHSTEYRLSRQCPMRDFGLGSPG